mgnify:FL=1
MASTSCLGDIRMEVYGDDPCELFIPRTNASDATFDEKTTQLIARMHKAITIIQFKLEGEIIRRVRNSGWTTACCSTISTSTAGRSVSKERNTS